MHIRFANYRRFGGPLVAYDAEAACWCCGEPVTAASIGGTAICPWCDCGMHRDGAKWTIEDADSAGVRYRKKLAEAQAKQERLAPTV